MPMEKQASRSKSVRWYKDGESGAESSGHAAGAQTAEQAAAAAQQPESKLVLQPGQRKLPLKAIFRKLDADDSGHLDRGEIKNLMQCMGRMLTPEQFEGAWNAMDADGSGECGFDEFEQWFYRTQAVPRRSGSKTQLRRTKKELRRTFRNTIKKAGILAMGGYRAMLSEELQGQVRAMAKRPNARSPDDMKLLHSLRRMQFLAVLPESALIKVMARLQCTVVPANTVVIEEGEGGADKMFMILAGSVSVYRTHLVHGDLMEHVGDLGPLEHFGDEALVLGSSERPFTVESREETIFCTLSRADYEESCKAEFEGGVVQKVMALRSLPVFYMDKIAALIAMSYATDVVAYGRGEVLATEGRRPPRMHVLLEGKIGVSMVLHLPGPEGSTELQPIRVRFATLSPGMAFGAESILVATDRDRASKGLNPREAVANFTYVVESAEARTVSFASDQFVKRASRPALKWLKAFQEETVTVKEIRKHAKRAGHWQREHREKSKIIADEHLAEDKPFRQAMEKVQIHLTFQLISLIFRLTFGDLDEQEMLRTKMVAGGIQLPRLDSPARYNKGANPRQQAADAKARQADAKAMGKQKQMQGRTPEQQAELHKMLMQMPLDQGYAGPDSASKWADRPGGTLDQAYARGLDLAKAMELVHGAGGLDFEQTLQQIDMAEAASMEQEYVPPPEPMGWMTEALQGDHLQAELGMFDTQDLNGLPMDDGESEARDDFLELKSLLETDTQARVRHHQEMADTLRINVASSEQMNMKFHKVSWDPLVQRANTREITGGVSASGRHLLCFPETEPEEGESQVPLPVGEVEFSVDEASGVPQVGSRVPISEGERTREVRTPLHKCLPGGGEQWEKTGYRESHLFGCRPTQYEWRSPIYVRSPERPRYKTPTSGSVASSGQLSSGGDMSLSYSSTANGADMEVSHNSATGEMSVINVDDRVRYHNCSLTDAAKEAVTLVATLRPPTDLVETGGGCGWLRYLHIVHSEWQRIGEAAKLHIFHLGRGDYGLVGGIPGTGSEVVPPTGPEMAAALADVAIALREAKETLGRRKEGERAPDGSPLPCLPPHLRKYNASSVRIALVMGTAIFRTGGRIPATSEPLHYHLQGDSMMKATALAASAPPNGIVIGEHFRSVVQYKFEVDTYNPADTETTVAQPDLEITMASIADEVEAESAAAYAIQMAKDETATLLIGRLADTSTFLRAEEQQEQSSGHATHVADTIEGAAADPGLFEQSRVMELSSRASRRDVTLTPEPTIRSSPTRSSPSPISMRSGSGSPSPNAASDRYRRMARESKGARRRLSPHKARSSPAKARIAVHQLAPGRRMTHLGPLGGEMSPVPRAVPVLPQIGLSAM